ncbi:spore germination protein [Paenibacillus sp. 1001270B_150601_E10]|uniref:spore germination protein n=1 Tax=Paenibacillus sp. 1001270B_150601_E10 TaxID=2787079 RepID=UPI00189E3FF0|nr:spore germination protein [Paenibacillus sp. 1001270B_150601_E10]
MWNMVVSYFPSWEVLFQALVVVAVPFVLSQMMSKTKDKTEENAEQEDKKQTPQRDFTGKLDHDLSQVRAVFGQQVDVNIRTFCLGNTTQQAAIIFINGISDRELIDQHILKSLMGDLALSGNEQARGSSVPPYTKHYLKNHVLSIGIIKEVDRLSDLSSELQRGHTALFVDNSNSTVIILGTRKEITRSAGEPSSEILVRGPRLGFNESICDNTTLLRQHGEPANLMIDQLRVGQRVAKELSIAYIKDIADDSLVQEVRNRIERIGLDDIQDTGYIEQLIEDNFLSPFPQVQSTERLDRVISALMEGRIAILLDGTPFVLTVPTTFNMLLQSPEDYYERWIPGTLVRMLRYFAAFVSTFGPSLYISFISFHQGLIPTKLALSIADTRAGVPFPSLIEVLVMEVALEILREAGLRLPKPIGQTIGIVGGLVIGEAAVQAGIVSPLMVIVVAVTAISSFAIPQYNAGIALRILRFIAMIFAATFGLYGVVLFFLLLCSHLAKLKSFGVPYISPASSYQLQDWKDFFVRMPFKLMKQRPKMTSAKNPLRKK